jgi:uncharacterized protein
MDPLAVIEQAGGFDWDAGNIRKNQEKHGVAWVEAEQVFFNDPLIAAADETHSMSETRYYVLGRTNAGRELYIVFTLRRSKIRVVSARDMSRRERKIYRSHE